MRTQYYTATSLDGFIATEDDSLEWQFPLGDIGATGYPEFIAGVGALAMGSATYEWMLRNSEQVVAEVGSAWPYSQPTQLPGAQAQGRRFVLRTGEHVSSSRGALATRSRIGKGATLRGSERCVVECRIDTADRVRLGMSGDR